MTKLFNTVHEVKLRLLLLLSAVNNNPVSLGRLWALDQLIIYGKAYNITPSNLNGNIRHKLTEYSARYQVIRDALNLLVLSGCVDIIFSNSGFHYVITDCGVKFTNMLNDDYKDKYIEYAHLVIDRTESLSEIELEKLITSNL